MKFNIPYLKDDFNIESWIYPLKDDEKELLSLYYDTTEIFQFVGKNDKCRIYWGTSPQDIKFDNSGNYLNKDKWHFVNINFINSTKAIRLIVNTYENSTQTTTSGFPTTTQPIGLYLGKVQTAFFRNVKVYSSSITSIDVFNYKYSQAYNTWTIDSSSGIYKSNLQLYLPLNEIGPVIYDLSFNNKTFPDYNGATYSNSPDDSKTTAYMSMDLKPQRTSISTTVSPSLIFYICDGDLVRDTRTTTIIGYHCIQKNSNFATLVRYNNANVFIDKSSLNYHMMTNTWFVHFWYKYLSNTSNDDFAIIGNVYKTNKSTCTNTVNSSFFFAHKCSLGQVQLYIENDKIVAASNSINYTYSDNWTHFILEYNLDIFKIWANGNVIDTYNADTIRGNPWVATNINFPTWNHQCHVLLGYDLGKDYLIPNNAPPTQNSIDVDAFQIYQLGFSNLAYNKGFFRFLYQSEIDNNFVDYFYIKFDNLITSAPNIKAKESVLYDFNWYSNPISPKTDLTINNNSSKDSLRNSYLTNCFGLKDCPLQYTCPALNPTKALTYPPVGLCDDGILYFLLFRIPLCDEFNFNCNWTCNTCT